MKQLQHYIAALTLTCLITTACSSDSYPGLEYEYDTSSEAVNTEQGQVADLGIPLRVFVNEQSFFTSAALNETRGTGPFVVPDTTAADSVHYCQSVFRLFAFRDRPEEQGPFDYVPDYTRRSGDTNDANGNCLIDGTEYTQGMPAHLKSNHTGEFQMLRPNLKGDTALHYSERYNDLGYRFFAYHIDDAKITNAQREGSRVYYDLEIDGTQDLMIGQSKKLTPTVLDRRHGSVQLTPEQRNKVLNIGNYSSYASNLGIYPIVDMRRMLARLQFMAYPADPSCDSVFIDSISIESKHLARLVVVARDSSEMGISFQDKRKQFWLKGRPNKKGLNPDSIGIYPLTDLNVEDNLVKWQDGVSDLDDWTKNKPTRIGADMMVAPDSVFAMTLHYRQLLNHSETQGAIKEHVFRQDFRLPAPHIDANFDEESGKYLYKAGKIYIIRIAIYGQMRVNIEVDLEPWQEDGEIDLDTEDYMYP